MHESLLSCVRKNLVQRTLNWKKIVLCNKAIAPCPLAHQPPQHIALQVRDLARPDIAAPGLNHMGQFARGVVPMQAPGAPGGIGHRHGQAPAVVVGAGAAAQRVGGTDAVATRVVGVGPDVAQGIGQALLEHAVYDRTGQLLAGSFMDYALPRAETVPWVEVGFHPVPATTNPLGVKGCGEAGVTGALPAVMNAVQDALSARGVRHLDMPATPERIWRALRAADGR